jgi:hypothetical protein
VPKQEAERVCGVVLVERERVGEEVQKRAGEVATNGRAGGKPVKEPARSRLSVRAREEETLEDGDLIAGGKAFDGPPGQLGEADQGEPVADVGPAEDAAE